MHMGMTSFSQLDCTSKALQFELESEMPDADASRLGMLKVHVGGRYRDIVAVLYSLFTATVV